MKKNEIKHINEMRELRNLIDKTKRPSFSKNSFIDFDINNIPIEQLRKQYLNYSYELPFSSSDTSYKMVTETVNKSTPLNELRLLVIERFYLEDWQFLIREAHNNIDVALIVPNIPDSKDMIIQFMENEGYFRAGEREIKREEMNWLQIQFEPYYQLPITQEILNDETVYHMSPSYNNLSIETNGIRPSNEGIGGNSPKRVFVLRGYVSHDYFKRLAISLNNVRQNKTEYFLLYYISTSKLPRDIEFYADPEHLHAAYTFDTIPYSAITKIERIETE